MSKNIALILLVFLMGCSVTNKEWRRCEKLCNKHEGAYKVSNGTFDQYCYCKDGVSKLVPY